jgi:hypothetical protein
VIATLTSALWLLNRTTAIPCPDHFLFEDDLVRSLGDGGIVPGGRKAALLLFRGREDEIELFAGAAIVGVTKRLVLRAAVSVPVRFPSPPTSVNGC